MSKTLLMAKRVRILARDEARRQAAEALAAEAEAERAAAALRAEIAREAEAEAVSGAVPPGCATFAAWRARMQDRVAAADIAAEAARDRVARAREMMVEADLHVEQVEHLLRRKAAEAARAEAKRALEELNEFVIFRTMVSQAE
ncbi:MAG: hypothetical protein JSR21_10635 [Proteobacteria bacterium]|nr:hypothetical protein [Pseudomonadota bacterium]